MRKAFLSLVAATLVLAAQPAAAADPNDSEYRKQYGVQQMNAQDAWVKSTGETATGKPVIVAVVDTGVDLQHPELEDQLVAGYDFGDRDANPDDDSKARQDGQLVRGHGTGAAGVIAAETNNGRGIAGVAPKAQIMPLKIASENSFAVEAVPQAIAHAVSNGAKVINLSISALLSGVGLIGVIDTPCAHAYSAGVLCVVSSGNSGTRPSGYGRSFQGLLVTANDAKGEHASFAQHADTQWGVSSAGVAVYMPDVLEDGGWQFASGTSFSAPHAAGVAALLFAQGLTIQQVVDKMMKTATPMEPPSVNGAGMINAARAVGAPVVTPYSPPAPPPRGSVTPAINRGTAPPSAGGAPAPKGKTPTGGAPAAPEDTTPGRAGPDYSSGDGSGISDFLEGEEEAASTEDKKKTSLDPRLVLIGFAALLVISTFAGTLNAVGKAREAKRLGL